MKKIYLVLALLIFASPAFGSINLPWTTTFDCPEWTTYGDTLACDGISKGLAGSSANGNYTSILQAANYSGGAGGKGLRHYLCSKAEKDTFERHSIGDSGGAITYFVQKPTEFWVRWYVRFQAGYSVYGQKMLYHHLTSGSGYLNFPYDTNGIRYYEQSQGGLPPAQHLYCGDCGWQDLFGGASDGRWLCVEQHFKSQNPVSAFNGEYDLWIDGVLKIHKTDAKYSTSSTQWSDIYWGSNGDGHDGAPGDIYMDYDDIEISLTGYIGPIGGGGDAAAPITSNHSPSGAQNCVESDSTQDVTVSFNAVDATTPINCELSTSSTFTFGTGTAMSPTDGGSGATYSYTFADQACNASYTYYRKCQDSAGTPNTNDNTDAAANPISYSIGAYASEATPPVITVESPSNGSELVCIYNPRDVTVQASATDATPPIQLKISSINDFDFDTQGSVMNPETNGASGEIHSYIFNGANQLACNDSYTYYIKARDAEGNTSTQTTLNFSIAAAGSAELLFQESFEDSSFSSRGWYDGSPSAGVITSGGVSGNCVKFTFAQGNTGPTNWQTIRHYFTASEELTVVVWWKLDNSWVGSGHSMYITSDLDSQYSALANNYLQLYIEEVGLSPAVEIQDTKNVNTSQTVPYDFANAGANQTENRSVNYCNGYLTTQSTGSAPVCFSLGGGSYYSSTYWYTSTPFTHNEWVRDETYFRFNSIVDGKAVANGVIERKLNGTTVLYVDNAVMRTGQYPGLKVDKFVIAPYIGAGSSVAQSYYLDELSVFNGRLFEDAPPTTPGRFGLTNVNSGATPVTIPGDIPVTVYP